MNTRVSRMVAVAQTMTAEERVQWLKDIENEHGKNSTEYEVIDKATIQSNAIVGVLK